MFGRFNPDVRKRHYKPSAAASCFNFQLLGPSDVMGTPKLDNQTCRLVRVKIDYQG